MNDEEEIKELKEMASAHLQQVDKTIAELHAQKLNIETQIHKLVEYYQEKVKFLNNNTLERVQSEK